MRTACLIFFLLAAAVSAQGRGWREVQSFACQLQDLNLKQAQNSPFDLLIMDYSLHGDDESAFTAEQLAGLKKKPDGTRRYLVAYLSIGEAEDYRFYWKPEFREGSPAWLGATNPQWPGNYAVDYWDPAWKAVVLKYLDKILEAGFDGVFLDKVDAYEIHPDRPTARSEMSQFVQEIARHARERAGEDFGIFPQNSEDLFSEPGYLETITGVSREETYYGYPNDSEPSPKEWTQTLESKLRPLVEAGKLVLCIDYAAPGEQAQTAIRRASENGFLVYVADRPLAVLQVAINTPPEPPVTPERQFPWRILAIAILAIVALYLVFRKR